MLEALRRGADKYQVDLELQRSLRDVLDHALRIAERADGFRVLLENALVVHSTLVTQQQNDVMRELTESGLAQNEEVKKISSWAAILFAPTLVGTIYGMNFTHMPELDWRFGYPLALTAMVVMGFVLYRIFKRRRWL
jgi:magnesium transporter